MNRINKWVSVIVLVCMLVSLLCSCSSLDDVEESTQKTSVSALLHSEKKESYEEAIESILAEDEESYSNAVSILEELGDYRDSEILLQYLQLRGDTNEYIGRVSAYYERLDGIEVENEDVQNQIELYKHNFDNMISLHQEIDDLTEMNYPATYIEHVKEMKEKLENCDDQYLYMINPDYYIQEYDKEIKAAEEREAEKRVAAKKAMEERVYYWTPSGKKYHSSRSCPSLSRSKNIESGHNVPGGRDACDRCC